MTAGGQAERRKGGSRGARRHLCRAGVVVALLLAVVPPCRLSAQSNPRLLDAVRLAQAGRSDSAHAVVSRILASTAPGDSLYPEVIYTMGLVAGDLDEMQHYFQRVVVEHSATRWADVSLYRLAQIAYVRNDWAGATRQLEKIRSDYPTSALLPRAAFYAADIYAGHLHDPAAACRWAADGLARAGGDAEMQKKLGEMREKSCGKEAAAPPAPTGAPPSARPPVRPSAFQVQVAAMATPAQAAEVVERLKRAGFDASVVTEKGFYKVRVGGYDTVADAAAGARAIKAKLGGSPFVVRP